MSDSSAHVETKPAPEVSKPAIAQQSAAFKLLADCQNRSEPTTTKPEQKPEAKPEAKTEAKPAEQKTSEQKTEPKASDVNAKAKAEVEQADRLLKQRTSSASTEKSGGALSWLDTMTGGIFRLSSDKQKPAATPTSAKVESTAKPTQPTKPDEKGGFSLSGLAKSGIDAISNVASATSDAVVKNVFNPIANGFTSVFDDDSQWKASSTCTPSSTAECQWISDVSKKDLSWTKDLNEFELSAKDLSKGGCMGNWAGDRAHWGADEATQAACKVATKIYEKDGALVYKQNGKETKLEDVGNGVYNLKLDEMSFVYDRNNFKLEATKGSQKVEVEARTPPPLELPKDAREAGTTTIDDRRYKIFKDSDNSTYLVQNDKVISKVNSDGSHTIALPNGHLEVKMTQKPDGTYEVERMERWSAGRIRKAVDGDCLTTYFYNEAGERREKRIYAQVMTREQIDRMRTELPPDSMAIVHTGDPPNQHTYVLRNHGKDDNGKDRGVSEVEIRLDSRTNQPESVNGRTRLFRDGQEFRINEKDEVLVIGPDGQPRAVDKLLGRELAQRFRQTEEVTRRQAGVVMRANANGGIDVRMGSADESDDEADKEDDDVTTINPNTDEPIVSKEQNGEKTVVQKTTGAFEMLDGEGKRLVDFDPKTGVTINGIAGEIKVDWQGMKHVPSGLSMDNVGNVRFADGSMFVDCKGVCHVDGSSSSRTEHQYRNAEATGKSEMAKASSLIGPARGVICGAFDPATAESLCTAAYGGLSGAISLAMASGNTEMAGQLMSKQAEASHWIGLSASARKATVAHAHELPGGGSGMTYMMADAARNAVSGTGPNEAFLTMLAKVDPTNPKVATRAGHQQGSFTMTSATVAA